jgi:gamma-glutamyl:cysteine ligase YbdK (ATP-grasp superfamily)
MKIGVELEYWVTDSEGRLVSSRELAEKLEFAEQEFVEPLIEIKTRPNSDFQRIKEEITEKLRQLVRTAEQLDQRIVPLGTPLNSEEIEKIPSERGEIQEEIVGEDLEAAKRVAGTHIHFEKKDVKDQLNRLTALDPALALTNSSTYYQGGKTSSSSRNQVYRYRCYSNFPQHGQLWNYVESVDEWKERVDEAFEEFLQAGKKQGITSETIEENFCPENAIWTPVRLRKDFPTVEWRAPDVGKLEDSLRMVKEVKEVMEEDDFSKPSFEELGKISEKAIEEGIQSRDVREYLLDCGFDVGEYSPLTQEIESGENLSLQEARKIRLSVAEEFSNTVNSY